MCIEGRQCQRHWRSWPSTSQGKSPGHIPPLQPSEGTNLPTPRSWTSIFWNCEIINFYCLSHMVCGSLLQEPWQSGTHSYTWEVQGQDLSRGGSKRTNDITNTWHEVFVGRLCVWAILAAQKLISNHIATSMGRGSPFSTASAKGLGQGFPGSNLPGFGYAQAQKAGLGEEAGRLSVTEIT